MGRLLTSQYGFAVALILVGCGADTSLTFEEKLVIGMVGDFTAPDGATGNAEPRNVTMTLNSVTLTSETAGEIDFFTEEATEFMIASRSQILFEESLSDYVDDTITSVNISFAVAGTAKGKYEDELAFVLENPVAVYAQPFTVNTGKLRRINVLLQWRNIVTRDETVDPPTETITPPSLEPVLVE